MFRTRRAACPLPFRQQIVALAATGLLGACAAAPAPQVINDPNEADNREIHAFNRAIDSAILKPLTAGQTGEPGLVGQGIGNFASNLDLPGAVVNNLLQLRIGQAAENTLRFGVNTVLGIGGLFDPATALGVEGRDSDFGETLHVWGAPEGAYVELPLLGPSTDRDTFGMVVDYALNPLRFVIPKPERSVVTAAGIASTLGDRGRYSETVDSILYDSADSYAQARLLYLQNRRFELGQTSGDDDFEDPYEDPYAE